MNRSDELEDGLCYEEAIAVAKILEKCHVDGIEISCGMIGRKVGAPNRVIRTIEEEGYNFKAASDIASQLHIPVFVVGGFRRFVDIESRLQSSKIAVISLGRHLICEPDLPKKWMADHTYESQCKSCNQCFLTNPLECRMNH
ncbi:beta/alpha barrel domain-containing protein [Anaeromicropila herbilytica]|uniref:hypothetical protein n=1 Tax=Anaeromicropila herbilytica TaxID=2785025 RepID=UPI00232A1BCA|nr:hypothetical protein [Anaeromicropila herbilytica]